MADGIGININDLAVGDEISLRADDGSPHSTYGRLLVSTIYPGNSGVGVKRWVKTRQAWTKAGTYFRAREGGAMPAFTLLKKGAE